MTVREPRALRESAPQAQRAVRMRRLPVRDGIVLNFINPPDESRREPSRETLVLRAALSQAICDSESETRTRDGEREQMRGNESLLGKDEGLRMKDERNQVDVDRIHSAAFTLEPYQCRVAQMA